MKKPTVAIVVCTESGDLECMSRLLVKSIRLFGGTLKDSTIYSIQPRNPRPLSPKTLEIFKELNVHHEYKLLNHKYPDYGLANKIAACDYYAQKLTEDYLLFLDSDNVVFNDLSPLLTKLATDVQISVVGQKGVGTDGNDENTSYWEALYSLCGVKSPSFVNTGIERKKIFSYYNSGLIFARRNSGLFQQWKMNFDLVMSNELMPNHGLFFVEQSTFSATLSSMGLRVAELPSSYNYSPQRHFHLPTLSEQLTLDQIHTFHYHHLFRPPNKVHFQRDFSTFQGDKLDWLKKELVNCGINPKPYYEQWELELLTQKEQIIKKIKSNMKV